MTAPAAAQTPTDAPNLDPERQRIIDEIVRRIPEQADYWGTVRRNMILQVAAEIGRAPRQLRRAMLSRAWPVVRSHPGPGFRLNWLSRLVDVCLRSEVKRMLGWAGSAP